MCDDLRRWWHNRFGHPFEVRLVNDSKVCPSCPVRYGDATGYRELP